MKEKIAGFIVRFRAVWLFLLLALAVVAALSIGRTRVNYDLTAYLNEDTDTKRGLDLMNGEFEQTSFMSVVLIDADEAAAAEYAGQIGLLDGVLTAAHDPAAGVAERDGHRYRLIRVTLNAGQEEAALEAVDVMLADVPHLISGAAQDSRDLQESILREMPLVMAVSCAIVFAILLAMTRSWFEPVIFFLVIAVSILINMGTNWIFPSISFITFAVTAILQLALAMDYSIMLMNAFDRLRRQGLAPREAMAQALSGAFMPIASSALTTVAGMLALVFMRFTIGFDIGIVLAKGILISMLTVFLFMPGLLTLFAPLLNKTAHKPLPLKGSWMEGASSALHGLLPLALILLIALGAGLQSKNVYTYTIRDMGAGAQQVTELFGQSNQIVVLFPRDDSDEGVARQQQLAERLQNIKADGVPVVKDVMSMVTTGKAAVTTYQNAAEVAALLGRDEGSVNALARMLNIRFPIRGDTLVKQLSDSLGRVAFLLPEGTMDQLKSAQDLLQTAENAFNGPHYSRMLLDMELSYSDPHVHEVITEIKSILRELYGENTAMAGMLLAIDDIATSFSADMRRVSFITIGLVFLIVLISFKSLVIPLLLVCVIQGAIWINMAFSNWYDGSIFFMCYLICVALQMGATIDYGILLTSHYRELRRGHNKKASAAEAIRLSLPTVLTSGMALIVAGFSVGIVSSVFYISSIGTMLGRGAVVSVALVLFLLPRLLQLLDRWVIYPVFHHPKPDRE